MRKLILAIVAAWIVALPSIAEAQQQRGEGQGRPRVSQDVRRGGGGVLGNIAGPRLDRAHAERRDRGRGVVQQRPRGDRANARGRGGGGGGGGDRF